MRMMAACCVAAMMLAAAGVAEGAQIRGEYLEARTCDIYTGPCFANSEMSLSGKEAIMAWKVSEGTWSGTKVDGLGVALVVNAEGCLGHDGVFAPELGKVSSVILVDKEATSEQEKALVEFVKHVAAQYAGGVEEVQRTSFEFTSNFDTKKAHFKAGEIAEIETRDIGHQDHICCNESIYFQPLTKVRSSLPVVSVKQSYAGSKLDAKWTNFGTRSSFLATFRY